MVRANQVPQDLDGKGDIWKELTNKICWAIGTTYGVSYGGKKSWPRSVASQLSSILMRADVVSAGPVALSDLYQATVQAKKGGRCPRCSRNR